MTDNNLGPIRRIVTYHDDNKVARILSDAPAANRRGFQHGGGSTLMWCTTEAPCDVAIGKDIEDMGARVIGTQPPPGGSRFTINDLAPGGEGLMHRTESLDYAIILAGEIDMEVDEGERVSLNPGDVVIQRATNHSWINRGTTWGRIAFILLDAKPLGIGHPIPFGASAGDRK